MNWKIGNVEIKNKVCLAPMAGVCDSAFRRICKEMGVGLIFAEMVSDKALCYDSKKTFDMLYMTDDERPIAQQIFGSDPESMAKAAKIVYEKMKPEIIDINMGCPVPKVAVKSSAGSGLLKNPKLVEDIIRAVVNSVPIPVTVKIRSGWDSNNINAVEIAKIAEKAGASAITVHPRTRAQGYEGHSDWNIIKQVKENVNIPVIGNGDIKSVDDAIKIFEETNCDAIMIGRGALGNPFLFKEIIYYLETGEKLPELSKKEKLDLCKKHLKYLLEFKNEKVAVLEMRTHAAWYLKGLKDSVEVKKSIFKCTTANEMLKIINDYEKK